MFGNQKEAADKEMSEYIAKQQSNIQNEKARFAKLQTECTRAAQASAEAINKANEAGAKAQAELDQKVRSFCRKYDNLRNSPVPSCDNANKLAEDLDGVAARLSSQTSRIALEYSNVCNQYNNESSDTLMDCNQIIDNKNSSPDQVKACKKYLEKYSRSSSGSQNQSPKAPSVKLKNFCKDENTDDNTFVKKALGKLSNKDKEALPQTENRQPSVSQIVESLKSGSYDDFADEDNFFQKLADEFGAEGKITNICKTLTAQSKSGGSDKDGTVNKAKSAQDDIIAKLKKDNPNKKDEEIIAMAKENADYKAQDKIIADSSSAPKDNSSEIDQKLSSLLLTESEVDLDPKALAFKKLGEQATGSCDAESTASNSSGKNPLFFDINSYDSKKGFGGVSQ